MVNVSGFSYPSGHSLATAALCITIARDRVQPPALAARRRWRWSPAPRVVLLVALVGLSRVYLGVHYPSDVLSGISLGTSWALMLAAAVAAIGAARRATT